MRSPAPKRQGAKRTPAILFFMFSHKFSGTALIQDAMGWEDPTPMSWEDSSVKQKVANDQIPSLELPPHAQAPGFLLSSPA